MSSTAAKKTTKKSVAASAAPAAPAAPAPVVAAPAPVVVAAPAPVVAAPAPVVAAPAPAVVAHTEGAEQVNITAEFTSLVEQVNTLRTTLSTVFSNMRKLEKQIPRELKKAQKGGRRRKAATTEGGADAPKKETVFTRPVPISDALCTFLGVSKGTLLSRSEVTTRVCQYAKNNKLMEKQVIKADASLRKLLALNESDELKILNLQRYLKPHYTKPAATA